MYSWNLWMLRILSRGISGWIEIVSNVIFLLDRVAVKYGLLASGLPSNRDVECKTWNLSRGWQLCKLFQKSWPLLFIYLHCTCNYVEYSSKSTSLWYPLYPLWYPLWYLLMIPLTFLAHSCSLNCLPGFDLSWSHTVILYHICVEARPNGWFSEDI